MRPKERRESGQNDLFRARLDQIVDVGHPLCEARQGDRLAVSGGPVRSGLFRQGRASAAADAAHGGPGDSQVDARPVGRGPVRALDREPVLPAVLRRGVLPAQDAVRPLVADALAPKDGRGEARRADPGEPCDRDANRRGKTLGLQRVIVDTTVQPKAVAFPTDAKLMHRARERLVRLAKKTGVSLRQSYERVGKHALIAHQRYAHAKQFKRANRALRTIRTYLGRVCRDLVRKTSDDAPLSAIFAQPLSLAFAVREQRQHQRGRKIYSLHAPEVECIGKGKAHRPYEFGVKVSLATTLHRSKGGQFIAHVKAMPGNPYDGHTLATVLPEIEAQIGAPLTRIVADRGYRGHNASPDMRFKVYISGQKRGVTDAIKRELRRRSAVEPVIGHAKAEHRMGRNFLKGPHGDAANAILAAAGYNFRRLLAWLAIIWRVLTIAILAETPQFAIIKPV